MSFTGQLASFLNRIGLAWWAEVKTQTPQCTYFFGPFNSAGEAEKALPGFLADLEAEGASGIQSSIQRCQPNELTVCNDDADCAPTIISPLGPN